MRHSGVSPTSGEGELRGGDGSEEVTARRWCRLEGEGPYDQAVCVIMNELWQHCITSSRCPRLAYTGSTLAVLCIIRDDGHMKHGILLTTSM